MKPVQLTVVESTTRPGLLSVRVDPKDPTATAFYRALMESGAKVGDVLEVRLALPGEPRKHGSQMLDFDEGPFSEGDKEAARAAMSTPLAQACRSALLVVAQQSRVGECDEDACWFPLCLSQGCEGEPVREGETGEGSPGARRG